MFNSAQNSSDALAPIPVRYIGRMPVYTDQFGEYAYATIKVWHPRAREFTEIKAMVDANIDAIRAASSLEIRTSAEIARVKKPVSAPENPQRKGLCWIVHRNSGHACQTGANSLPQALHGNPYLRARHQRENQLDFRREAFKQVEPA